MAGNFEALEELLDETIKLPIRSETYPEGRVYTIHSPSARDGLTIERLTNAAVALVNGGENLDTSMLDDDEERDLYQRLLGSAYDEMLADKVSWAWLRHASLTALLWVSSGLNTAERFWKAAGDPEQLAPNREARRQRGGSAAAKSTRQRGSSNGTNRRRASNGRPRPATPK